MYNSNNMINNMTYQNNIMNPSGFSNGLTCNTGMINTGLQNNIMNPSGFSNGITCNTGMINTGLQNNIMNPSGFSNGITCNTGMINTGLQNSIMNPSGFSNGITCNTGMINTGLQNVISTLNPQINPIENNDDEEIIKNIEKTAIKKYTSQDTTFLFTHNSLYTIINNSINNDNYIKNSFECILPNCTPQKITKHIFWFQGLQYIPTPPSWEKIIEYAYHISQEFIFLTFKQGDFISLNTGQVLLINLDSILRKIKVDGVTLDFFSPLNLPLLQNLQVSLNTDKELFLDGKVTYKKEELACLKTIQEKIEIVKRGKNNG